MRIRWVTYRITGGYRVLGSGYDRPEDLVLSGDRRYAYVTERGGKLLKVRLSNARRSAATVVASGMAAPHQISLDEAAGQAYVVEFSNSGRLLRINLANGRKTVLATGLKRAIGLLMSADKRFAYVSLQAPSGHRVERIDLAAANREVIASGLNNPSTNRFVLTTTTPSAAGFYRVRRPTDVWYTHWLAARLPSMVVADGLYRIRVRTYASPPGSAMATDSFLVRIDNQRATASIDEIIHHHATTSHVVGECAIIDQPLDAFRFRVTAWDPQGHLKSYNLRALWGNNKSKPVASRTYAATASKKWFGLAGNLVPSSGTWSAKVDGDPSSTRCAHTFYLTVWDRVINGYVHLHKSTYHESITIMLS